MWVICFHIYCGQNIQTSSRTSHTTALYSCVDSMFCKTYTVQSGLLLSPCSCWGFGSLLLKLENSRNRRVRKKVLTFLVCEQTLYFWWKKGATREPRGQIIPFLSLPFSVPLTHDFSQLPQMQSLLAGFNILSSYTKRVILHAIFYMKSSAQRLPFFWINLSRAIK